MMGVTRRHFNRRIGTMVVAALTGLGAPADAQIPERVRVTPEIRGRLAYNGAPLAGAAVAIVVHEVGTPTGPNVCGSPAVETTNDSGSFSLGAKWRTLTSPAVRAMRRATADSTDRFLLCVRLQNTAAFNVWFVAPAVRWDTLRLGCDYGRPYLPPDLEGREGYCVAEHAAVDHVQLAAPPAGNRSPDLRCDTTTAVIQRLRVGPVRVNGSIAELRRLCPSLRDTIVQAEGWFEPSEQRALVLTIGGTPVIVHPAAGVIAMISIRAPGLETADSVGVGTRLSRLRRLPGLRVVGGRTDIPPFAVAWTGDECGIGYYVAQPGIRRDRNDHELMSEARLRAWAGTLPVRRIVVGFCPSHKYPALLQR